MQSPRVQVSSDAHVARHHLTLAEPACTVGNDPRFAPIRQGEIKLLTHRNRHTDEDDSLLSPSCTPRPPQRHRREVSNGRSPTTAGSQWQKSRWPPVAPHRRRSLDLRCAPPLNHAEAIWCFTGQSWRRCECPSPRPDGRAITSTEEKPQNDRTPAERRSAGVLI